MRPMFRSVLRVATVAAVATLAVSLAACSSNTPAPKSTTQKPLTSITVAVASAAIEHTPVYIAIERGIFADNGLTVKVQAFPTGVEIANAIKSGAADFGLIGGVPTMTTAASGAPIKVIAMAHGDATSTVYSPFQGIVASPKSGIKEGEFSKLAGKKIGVPLGSGGVPYLQGILKDHGVDPSSVTLVNVAPADAYTALQQGLVDAVCLFQPFPTLAPEKVPGATVVVNGGSKTWFDPGPIVAMEDTMTSKKDVAVEFLTSIAEAQFWMRGHLKDAGTIASHWYTGLSAADAAKAFTHDNYDMRLSANVIKGWKDTEVPFLVSQKTLPASFDPSTMVDASAMYTVETEHPELFKDLKPVAKSDLLK